MLHHIKCKIIFKKKLKVHLNPRFKLLYKLIRILPNGLMYRPEMEKKWKFEHFKTINKTKKHF